MFVRGNLAVLINCLGLCVLVMPRLLAFGLLNFGQSRQLLGNINPDIYRSALSFAPQNVHIRWQAGLALANAGEPESGLEILLPLASESESSWQIAAVLNLLVSVNRVQEAANLYYGLHPRPLLPSGVAASLAYFYLQHSGTSSVIGTGQILPQVFGLNPFAPEVEPLRRRLSDQDLRTTEFGSRLYNALDWVTYGRVGADGDISLVPVSCHSTVPAVMLGVKIESLTFGSELIRNGGFEQRMLAEDAPSYWRYVYTSTGDPWNLGAFVIGTDRNEPFTGKRSLRIDGLLIEWLPERERARGGAIHIPVLLQPRGLYTVCFVYRTENAVDGTASLWLSRDSRVLFSGDLFLPDSHGQWKMVTIIAMNQSDSVEFVQPLLRVWREGSVWFDDFSIRELYVYPPVPLRRPLVDIRDVE